MAGWDKCKVFCAWLSSEPVISFLKKKKKKSEDFPLLF